MTSTKQLLTIGNIYFYICHNAENIKYRELNKLLMQHELICLAKMLKGKFNDTRSPEELKEVILDELGESVEEYYST